ncbi:MAG: hypothetical protein ABW056_10550 [Thermoanaerobaculia bacterium]
MIDDKRWRALAQAVRREVVRRFPDWTGGNAHDPGVALIELFTFLAENLLYRPIGAGRRTAVARRLVGIASALATTGAERAERTSEGPLRVNYFFGQLLDVDDFTAEQSYVREKFRRRNRRLHGWGIVTGLDVSTDRRGGGARAVVAPGFALDRRGEEIEVPRRTALALPAKGTALFVQVRYAERLRRPTPALGKLRPTEGRPYSRVEETFEISLAPSRDARSVTLARLTRARRRWTLDPRFEPPRLAPGSG